MIKTYDPKKNLAVFNGIPLNFGVAPDTFFTLEYDEDAFEKQVGAGGEVTRSLSQNRGAKFKCTLMASSLTNNALSLVYNFDIRTGTGVGEFQQAEINGTTLFHGSDAWLTRLPTTERAKTAGTVEWQIDIADLDGFVGGLVI